MNRLSAPCATWLALLATTLPLLGQSQDAAKPAFQQPKRIGTLPKREIPESSGIARSRRHADLYWTHNDSGGKPEIFAVHKDGTLVRRVLVPGATNVDWEEIAVDAQNRLVVADIGDNFLAHDVFTLYRFAEPDPAGTETIPKVETFRCVYPNKKGPINAEAMFVCGDWAFVGTKEKQQTRLFRIPLTKASEPGQVPIEAEFLGVIEDLKVVTAASLSDDSRHLAILTYLEVVVLDLEQPLQPQLPAAELDKALQNAKRRDRKVFLGQCEGITWNGRDLVVSTEQGPFSWGEPLLWQITANSPPTQAEGMK